jgi:hypothetical protein
MWNYNIGVLQVQKLQITWCCIKSHLFVDFSYKFYNYCFGVGAIYHMQ